MTGLMDALSPLLTHPLLSVWITDPDPAPSDNDVKAGWTAFTIFLLLIAALVVLMISFVRQLRKVDAAKKAGLYGVEPDVDTETSAHL